MESIVLFVCFSVCFCLGTVGWFCLFDFLWGVVYLVWGILLYLGFVCFEKELKVGWVARDEKIWKELGEGKYDKKFKFSNCQTNGNTLKRI